MLEFSHLHAIEWDMKTKTAGDYTIEMKVERGQWRHFVDEIYDSTYPTDAQGVRMSQGAAFKQYLMSTLPDKILAAHSQATENDDDEFGLPMVSKEHVKVGIIQLAFTNSKLINLLKVRGARITAADFEGVRNIEKEITQLKENSFDDFTRPSVAFITFEEVTGYDLALKYFEDVKPSVGS